MVKVMHIVLTAIGGTEVYNKMLIDYTDDVNDIVYVCPSYFDKSNFKDKNVVIYNLDVPREISPLKDLKAIVKIRKIINKEHPQIVYCHSSMAGAVGRIAAFFKNCKVIYNPHGWSFDMTDCSDKKRKVYILIERFLARFTNKIITISEHEKQIAIENKICNPEKLEVVLNGVDVKAIQENIGMTKAELGFADNEPVVGCIARITDQKDPLLFAKVAGEIAKYVPNVKFVWVGDGELRQEFEEALKENSVFDKTLITGWVSSPHLYSYAFDVSTLFSKWEGFGLVICEALAQGKPVVATNVGGISEIINDSSIGAVVKSRDENVLADVVISYLNYDNATIEKCKQRASEFDFSRTAEKTLRIYDELVK